MPPLVLAAALATFASGAIAASEATPPPLLRATVAVPIGWRAMTIAPEIGAGSSFGTDTPSLGLEGAVSVAPLRWFRRRAWWTPIELEVAGSYRTSSASVTPSGGGSGSDLVARETRASAMLTYPVCVGARFSIAPRAGWSLYRFAIDRDPVPRMLRTGPEVGLEASQLLPGRLVADASARLLPFAGPSGAERAAFGQGGTGWGFGVGVALRGHVAGPFGWRVAYDFLRFSDSYSGAGSRSIGGEAEARHHTLSFGVTFESG